MEWEVSEKDHKRRFYFDVLEGERFTFTSVESNFEPAAFIDELCKKLKPVMGARGFLDANWNLDWQFCCNV